MMIMMVIRIIMLIRHHIFFKVLLVNARLLRSCSLRPLLLRVTSLVRDVVEMVVMISYVSHSPHHFSLDDGDQDIGAGDENGNGITFSSSFFSSVASASFSSSTIASLSVFTWLKSSLSSWLSSSKSSESLWLLPWSLPFFLSYIQIFIPVKILNTNISFEPEQHQSPTICSIILIPILSFTITPIILARRSSCCYPRRELPPTSSSSSPPSWP